MARKKPKEKDAIDLLLDNFENGRSSRLREKRLPLFNDQIISMYAFGMSCRDIQSHLKQVYGVAVSPELITRVTDFVMEDVKDWQSRPLEKSYPILYPDALRINCRQDGKTLNKALYAARMR